MNNIITHVAGNDKDQLRGFVIVSCEVRAVWALSVHTYVYKEKMPSHYVHSVVTSIMIKRNICRLCVAMCMYVHTHMLIATAYIHIYIICIYV